jgi:recombination protein RecA
LKERIPGFIPAGFRQLDGLLPRKRIIEISGGPSSGKTLLALLIVAAAQRAGLSCAWIDAELAFDPARAANLGVSLEHLPVARPESAETSIEIALQLAASGGIDLLVLDSAAALTPRIELETGVGDSGPGLQARVLASGIRRLASVIARTETAIIVLNQIRSAGDGETTAGGPALKLYASVRLSLEMPAEDRIRFRILKNKASEASAPGVILLSETGDVRNTP